MSREKRGTQALVAWCRQVTAGYPNVNIENMSTSWRNGLGFCAIIHYFRPDLIDFDSLQEQNILENNELAFRIAEEHLGVPSLLDPEDMLKYTVPDRLSILTYLSQFYQSLAANSGSCSKSASPHLKRSISPTGDSTFSEKLGAQPSTKNMIRREPCAICDKPIFLAEKTIFCGHSFHRSCFRCTLCGNLLNCSHAEMTDKGPTCIEGHCQQSEEEEASAKENVPPQTNTDGGAARSELIERLQAGSKAQEDSSDSEESSDNDEGEEATAEDEFDKLFEDLDKDVDDEFDSLFSEDKPTDDLQDVKTTGDLVDHSKGVKGDKTEPERSSKEDRSSITSDEERHRESRTTTEETNTEKEVNERSKIHDNEVKKEHEVADTGQISVGLKQEDNKDLINSEQSFVEGLEPKERGGTCKEDTHKETKEEIEDDSDKDLRDSNLDSKCVEISKEDITANEDKASMAEMNMPENCEKEDEAEDEETKMEEEFPTEDSARSISENAQGTEDSIGEVKHMEVSEQDSSNAEFKQDSNKRLDDGQLDISDKDLPNADANISGNISTGEDSSVSEVPRLRSEQPQPFNISSADEVPDTCSEENCSGQLEKKTLGLTVDKNQLERTPSYPLDFNPFEESVASSNDTDVICKNEDYPQDKNPFDDSEDEATDAQAKLIVPCPEDLPDFKTSTPNKKRSSYDSSLNPFWSDEEDEKDDDSQSPLKSTQTLPTPRARNLNKCPTPVPRKGTPSNAVSPKPPEITPKKKRAAPQPPGSSPVTLSPHRNLRASAEDTISEGSSSTASEISLPLAPPRKSRPAPQPPKVKQVIVPSNESKSALEPIDALFAKNQKEQHNMKVANEIRQSKDSTDSDSSFSSGDGGSDSQTRPTFGQWKKKRRAPPIPRPIKRQIKRLPMKEVATELADIEIKQQGLERQGVKLETNIREITENIPQVEGEESSLPVEAEDMILQLFELVNQKNELCRRQAELMYLKRQQRLEERHAELEYQIRCLMLKPESLKTEVDRIHEEQLIERLMEVVKQRSELVDRMDMDRVRENEEDLSIQQHLEDYHARRRNTLEDTPPSKPKKNKKSKKEKSKDKSGKSKDKSEKSKEKLEKSKDKSDKSKDKTEKHKEKLKNATLTFGAFKTTKKHKWFP